MFFQNPSCPQGVGHHLTRSVSYRDNKVVGYHLRCPRCAWATSGCDKSNIILLPPTPEHLYSVAGALNPEAKWPEVKVLCKLAAHTEGVHAGNMTPWAHDHLWSDALPSNYFIPTPLCFLCGSRGLECSHTDVSFEGGNPANRCITCKDVVVNRDHYAECCACELMRLVTIFKQYGENGPVRKGEALPIAKIAHFWRCDQCQQVSSHTRCATCAP